ncbi:hypothetical protein An12g06820 [Aspergillus niger]|uniref:Uncharacterized protein n=3 Tax=Aspergillus niger TaxID=5061 RepID=A2QZZ9_ASPNC|nr:hypothetical protein An12g06820 [Aspergillus niger]CAK41211.1 hypothetical protein An12g06820 [Aspergillus niger]
MCPVLTPTSQGSSTKRKMNRPNHERQQNPALKEDGEEPSGDIGRSLAASSAKFEVRHNSSSKNKRINPFSHLRYSTLPVIVTPFLDPASNLIQKKDSLVRSSAVVFEMDADIWFREWASKKGQKLSNIQIERLVTLTKQWKNTVTSDTLGVWTSDPSAEFWGFEPYRTEGAWVRECLEIKVPTFMDGDKTTEDCEKVSARRRVLLIILHDIIQREILRLRASSQAQSVKFLTAAVRNIVAQAYPGKDIQKLCNKCIHLQRFERAKIENIEMEALVAFGEATYDKKHQNDMQEAFLCILNTCPFRQSGNSKPRLPSKSTRKRLRKKAARMKHIQKPSASPTTSRHNENQVIQNFPTPRHDTFSSLEKPPGSSRNSTAHLSEAQNAALVRTQPSQLQEENQTRETCENSPMPCVPVQLYSPGDNLSLGENMLFISRSATNPFDPHQGIHPLSDNILFHSQNTVNFFDPHQGIHPLGDDIQFSSENAANFFDPHQGIHPLGDNMLFSSGNMANPFDPYQGIHPLSDDILPSSQNTANSFDPQQGVHPLRDNMLLSSQNTANPFDPYQGIHPLSGDILPSSQNTANLFDPQQGCHPLEGIIQSNTESLVYPFDPTT